MKIRSEAPLTLTHRHLDQELGPESRYHEHRMLLRVEIDDLVFDPSTGRIVDPKIGPVHAYFYSLWLKQLAAEYDGREVDSIHGIRPSFESFVRSLKERVIFTWPEGRVALVCLDEGWEVWA